MTGSRPGLPGTRKPPSRMDSHFDPRTIEGPLYEQWEARGGFTPAGEGAPYCIAIPPPNVTGRLHNGHGFQQTLMDALIRYHRMRGRGALWQMGTDHAAIATQMLVERQLAAEGVHAQDIGREAFVARVWEWYDRHDGEIAGQMRRMGASVDWDRYRFTMDEGFQAAVREVFVRLFDDGLIYKKKRLVNWDPVLGTAVSDLEVESEEEDGHLWHIRYPLLGDVRTAAGADHLVVATTRPETLLGDTGVAVHPDDERYRGLVGAHVLLPLVGRELPIVADAHVDPEFGTGCLKITPAHDFNDYEVGQRHGLAILNVFGAGAAVNDEAPEPYRGLDRFAARDAVVADLEGLGLLESVEPHRHAVPRGDRSNAVLEPWLTDQWWVDIAPLAAPAIAAVEDGRIRFVPKQFENVYFAWMRDVRDWCISRQQWSGHRIPAWYDPDGNVHVGRDEDEARRRAGLGPDIPLTQDPDALDTWFSSALWTFTTLGWPERTPDLARFHPTDVLVTGYDIIFFWVARMIMMTLRFMDEVPFRTVYIHGLVRDADGAKMSKTRGNGLDPLDIVDGIALPDLVAKRTVDLPQPQMAERIEATTRRDFPDGIPAYGADALRFTYCAMASPGRDVNFDLSRVEGYRNFCNKLWNATKFVLMNLGDAGPGDGPVHLSAADRWIRSRTREMLEAVDRAVDTYRFDLYANAIYDFAWHEYCDWYLELTKPVLWDESTDPASARGARRTLLEVLDVLLRAAHPIMPYITDTLWHEQAAATGGDAGTVMLARFPQAEDLGHDPEATAAIEWLKTVVVGVRTIRSEMGIPPRTAITMLLQGGDDIDRTRLDATETLLRRLAGIETVDWLDARTEPPPAAVHVVGELKVLVPLKGLIDVEQERARLTREIGKSTGELGRVQGKLANENFVTKAPEHIVAAERDKAADLDARLATLRAQLERLDAL